MNDNDLFVYCTYLDIVWVADHVRDGLEFDERGALGGRVHPLGVAQPLLERRLHVVDHRLGKEATELKKYCFEDTRLQGDQT